MNSIDSYKNEKGEIGRENIKRIIPYDDPFLFIDRVLRLEKKRIVAEKTAKAEEFKGHFKDFPIMPGALIFEGLGQAATLLVRYNLENHSSKDVLAYKIRAAKFYKPTFPGQTLRFEAKLWFRFKMLYFVNANVFRKDKLVSKMKMVLAVVAKNKFRGRYKKTKLR